MAYSEKNFNSMQEEAVKRVKEMQKRSRNAVDTSEQNDIKKTDGMPQTKEKMQTSRLSPLTSLFGNITGNGTKDKELFDLGNIKIDEEKALIGILIYILYKQNADIKLLLALGYLLL